jgi:hypothetical protein
MRAVSDLRRGLSGLPGGATALAGIAAMLSACSNPPAPPTVTTVCEWQAHAQQLVQVDADISVDSSGRAVIGDAHCPTTHVQLQLSATAERAGVGDRLTAASRSAAQSGHASIPVKATGVFWNAPSGAYFVAENIAGI